MTLPRWLRSLFAPARRPLRANIAARSAAPLEERTVPAVYRTVDGTGNNVAHPTWGAVNADLLRLAPAAYADGVSAPAGATRPSARAVSNAVADHPAADIKSDRALSNFVYAWGQFIDHDMSLTNTGTGAFNVAVPTGDAEFDPAGTGTKVIPLTRSAYDPATGTTSPRQQVNSLTAFLDGSMVYGSDAATAASLRAMTGGKMKTSGNNLLPVDATGFFAAGDVRANENPELTALQTLFVREHNRVAARLAQQNPAWTDETLYQEARRVVIGEIQAVTYNEFLPALLGPNAVRPYTGYNPNVDPGIRNEFSTAAYRFGHSMLGDDIEFLDDRGNEVRDAVSLKDSFFNPAIVTATGIDPLLKYLASDQAEEIDTKVVDSLRNFLFGQPGQGGMDLAALNIQRGRDHGLADYNTVRAAYGLPRVTSWAGITSDVAVQQQLAATYGNVNNVDLWVGGLAEAHVPGGSVGPTFARIISDQFARLRDGDRFYYERDLTGPALAGVRATKLSDVIKRNTTLVNLQPNVFVFQAAITGRVFRDGNHDGVANPNEAGVGGRIVQLLDGAGAVIATTITAADGRYTFSNLDLGAYRVREVLPPGVSPSGPTTRMVTLVQGGTIDRQDFGEQSPTPPPAPPLPPPPPRRGQLAWLAPQDDVIGGPMMML